MGDEASFVFQSVHRIRKKSIIILTIKYSVHKLELICVI